MELTKIVSASAAIILLAGSASAAGRSELLASSSLSSERSLRLADLNGLNAFRIRGAPAGDLAGTSVASGDVNGDGFSDLIIGAPFADPNGSESGATYVVFGRARGLPLSVEVKDLNGSNGFAVLGEAAGDRSGRLVSAGDVNGDGFSDLIIGASGADPNGGTSGAAYVVFGAAKRFPASMNLSGLSGTNGFQIKGEGDFGTSVSTAGDMNGDGFDDIVIGSPQVGGGYGVCGAGYVVIGSAEPFPPNLSLDSSDGRVVVVGHACDELGYFGESVANLGDINGDGFDDVTVYDKGFYSRDDARTYIVFGEGRSEFSSSFGPAHEPMFSAGDFNGDGFGDAITRSPDGSRAYVGFGGASPLSNWFTIKHGRGPSFRSTATAGDTNGDGLDDLIIGAPPVAYLLFGKAAVLTETSVAEALKIEGPTPQGQYGSTGATVSSAGDVNGDGFDDVIIGAPSTDGGPG